VNELSRCRRDLQVAPLTPPPDRPALWRAALAGLFVFVFAAVALSGPGRIDVVDGQTRYEVARSLAEHGDSVIRDKHVWFGVLPGRDGRPYTNYRFPQSGLGVLAIWAADATGRVEEARRQFFFTLIGPLACAALALTYAVWFRRLGHGPAASLGWAAAGIFCTPSWFYGTSTFDEALGAAAVVPAVAVAFLTRDRRPLLGAAAAGLLLGWAVNCKQPLGLFVLPTLAALYRPGVALRRQLAPLGLVLAGLALGGIAYKAYDWYKFPPDTCEPDRLAQQIFGRVWADNPLPGLAGLALSPSAGALWYCPTLLLSAFGWRRWRRTRSGFCAAALAASLLFALFVSCLTFFKGEPCWGPRYLTPVFALWWVFVPAAAARLRRPLAALVLALGALVQLLALSVDPERLFLRLGLPENYSIDHPWLAFDQGLSHLLQRPGEIREILACPERAPEFTPGPTPTYAPTLPSGLPVVATSTVGLAASPPGCGPLSAAAALPLRAPPYYRACTRAALRRYHVFSSLRPWWLSQQYLALAERPVRLAGTLLLLTGLGVAGLAVMAGACFRGRCGAGPAAPLRTGPSCPGAHELLGEAFQSRSEKTPAPGKNLT
jgi:hypothetical protein